MIITLLILICIYGLVRAFLPVFVVADEYWKEKFHTLPGEKIYQVYSSSTDKIVIPTGQWREIPTGITLAPFGVFKVGKYTIYPFGRIGVRIYPMGELKLKGLDVLPTVYTGVPRKEIVIIGTNWNPRQPFVIRQGMPIAYVELYRIPNFILVEVSK